MAIAITNEPTLIAQVPSDIVAGQTWIVVPSAGRAVGPISIPDYAAHIARDVLHPDLSALEALRIDPSNLPDC